MRLPRWPPVVVLAFTLLGWTSANERAPNPAAPYPASGTTTAARSHAAAASNLWSSVSALTRAVRSLADQPAGLSDDWSTRLSAAARRPLPSREPQPTTAAPSVEVPTMPASSVTTATVPKPASKHSAVQGLTETYPEQHASARRVVVRRKLLLPDSTVAPIESHASSVVYEASQMRPNKVAFHGSTEAASSPNLRVYSSAFNEKLVASSEKQGNQASPRPAREPHSQAVPRTVTIPYQVPQRAVLSPSPVRSSHIEASYPFKYKQHTAAPGVNDIVVRLPNSLRVPPRLTGPPLPVRTPKHTAGSDDHRRASHREPPLPIFYPRDTHTGSRGNSEGSSIKHGPVKEDFPYLGEYPYTDDTSSYEESGQREPHGHGSEVVHAPYRRPLYTFPKPIDFGLSKMNQKGCKTTVKELKHVPKDAIGASSDLHSLFRYKRGAPTEPKMTSIIMTKECFFPEDPAGDGSSTASSTRSKDNSVPASVYRYPSSKRAYLSNYDPQPRSTHNTPTYNSYYPRPPSQSGWRSVGSAPVFRASKFLSTGPSFTSSSFDGAASREPAPYSSGRYDRENSDRRDLRGLPSTVFRDDSAERGGRIGDNSPYGWRDRRKGSDEPRDHHGGHGTSPLASGHKPRRRGPPLPKTMNRSFAFYRRDENPEKDHFVESYSTARRKSFQSDYDSDRDGFFE